MSERVWENELREFLEGRLRALGNAPNQPVSSAGLQIAPPIDSDEARFFILGMESQLFDIDSEGYVNSSLITSSDDSASQDRSRIFNVTPPPARLCRETVCLLSTTGRLILDHGWLPRQVQILPTSGDGSAAGYGVDIAVKSITGELLAAVEIKRNAYELAKLRSDLHQCCKKGKHPEANCGFPLNHRNFEFCAAYKPKYFWAVAPGEEICFRITGGDNDIIHLEEFLSLPPRSIVEMQANC
jgi:hypothetical protein